MITFPLETISNGTITNLLLYVAILGVLLLVASLIRLKVPLLKKWHIPSSLVAGIIGIILGPYCLKLIPSEVMSTWSALGGVLMAVILAPAMMSRKTEQKKGFYKNSISAACYVYSITGMQYAIPMLLTFLIFVPMMGVNPQFANTFEAGWAGGHSMGAAMETVFAQLNWGSEGGSLVLVNATFGLLVGLVGGIILINVAVRKGWTKCLKEQASITADATEVYPVDAQPAAANTVVSSDVMDTFAFHAAILSFVLALGWILSQALMLVKINLPWFCCAVFAGLFTQKCILDRTKWGQAVDHKSFSRIQGLALEFVVAGSTASLNLPVVAENLVPIIITSIALTILMVLYVVVVGKRYLGYYWFETSMIFFGTCCGVAATGFTLLRVCDPNVESNAAEIYAARLIFTGFATGGGIITVSAPLWLNSWGTIPTFLVFLAIWLVPLVICEIIKRAQKKATV